MATSKKPNLGAVSAEYIFIDIVGYSKRLIEHQTAIVGVLNRIVRASIKPHRLSPDSVMFLPTGDGMCIALLSVGNPPDIQIQIALEILQRLHKYNLRIGQKELQFLVRIGINAKKDNVVIDINGKRNIAGTGINDAARIMAEADGSQILVGDRIVGDLKPHGKYCSAFRSYTATVKHGFALQLHQFMGNGQPFLNVEVPRSFRPPADAKEGRTRSALRAGGLKIRVQIGPTAAEIEWSRLVKVEPKKSLTIMALIDTGASVTVVNPQVAVSCGLRQVGEARISTSSGQIDAVPEYVGSIGFPDSKLKPVDPVRILACSLPGQDFSCLLGRDVLANWRVIYDGHTGQVEIED